MSERPAHWTDDLIEAVRRALPDADEFLVHYEDSDLYEVIAAVEDWQEARWGPECWVTTVEDAKALFLHRAQTAESQIQAVRDVCDEAVRRSRRKSLGYAGIHYVAVEDVRDALGGGAP